MSERYYAILVGGRSRHDGDYDYAYAYPLPTEREDGTWEPGAWTPAEEEPRLWECGYHLTREPARWWSPGAECYEAEWSGAADGGDGVVIAVERCRLLRRLTAEELAEVRVFLAGEHEVRDGWCVAAGSARVRAYGTASVRAYGSASVRAYGSALVRTTRTTRGVRGAPTVTVSGHAVWVDERSGAPRVYTAAGELAPPSTTEAPDVHR